ncbi:MAG: 50S ribosomal protein L21 [Prevotellaceae bacterium]|jgi:large subunit ribosomal protein L21|nr:50S ribosomal protein L21 [Prevotellaceae bacterium]
MYAIVDIAGFQFNVEPGKKIFVHRLDGAEGGKVSFDKVLLIDADGDVKVGTPVVAGAAVNATILQNVKGDKVIVFKKKRRKGYQKKNGHRQSLTQIQIDEIVTAN